MSWLSSLSSSAGSALSSAVPSLATAAGNVFGSLFSSARQYQQNKQLMGFANEINLDNLRIGPSVQREGLEAAGYNPLLALSGYTSGLPHVSPIPVGNSDLSNLGSSAMSAFKMKTESDTERERKEAVKASVDVKKAESQDLKKSAELKDALKDKANADATRSKVESVVEPVRALSAVGGSVATAYGAKKIHDMFKDKGAVRGMNSLQRQRIEQLRKVVKAAARRNAPSTFLPSLGLLGSSLLGGAFSAKGTKFLMDSARREGHWTDRHGIERNPKWIHGGVPVVP